MPTLNGWLVQVTLHLVPHTFGALACNFVWLPPKLVATHWQPHGPHGLCGWLTLTTLGILKPKQGPTHAQAESPFDNFGI